MQFSCQRGCVKCCEREGFVYVSDQDIARLAKFLGMALADFEGQHIYRTKHTRRLRMRKACPFLKPDGCSVHPVKPTQCRTFPFWPELIENRAEWQALASWCPGINQGDFIPLEAMEAGARDMRAAYPHMYE
jgi:Fe-S-cluster containining protein